MDRIPFTIWESDLIFFSAYTPKGSIDERDNVLGSVIFALVHGLIDSSGFGDPIQKEYLEKGEAEYVQNWRGYLPYGEIGGLFYDPVKAALPSQYTLNQVTHEGPVPVIQLGVASENLIQVVTGKNGFRGQPVQHHQGQVPWCLRFHIPEK